MNIQKIQGKWNKRGFQGGLWVDPPGQVWRNYVHDVDELFMVVEGGVELEMNGKARRLKPGEEVLIPAHVVHTVRNVGETESRWLYAYQSRNTS